MDVRAVRPAEQEQIEAGVRSSEAFTLRRSQILLASSRGHRPQTIASHRGGATHTVRNAIHAFEQEGLTCLTRASRRPKTVQAELTQATCEALRAIVHQRPRTCGKPTSLWTLERAAAVCGARGLTEKPVSVGWTRANHGITSPDPESRRNKKRRDALLELAGQNGWEIGDRDEGWGSRLSQPNRHRWREEDEPLRVQERSQEQEDPDPKALACAGMLAVPSGRMDLRVVSGRPVSQVTTDVLAWRCERVQAQGTHVLLLLWDHASWHGSTPIRTWLREPHRTVLHEAGIGTQGVRIVPCGLPTTRPWLNRSEPTWVPGTRAIVEPARKRSARELRQRVCDSFDREPTELLAQKVA